MNDDTVTISNKRYKRLLEVEAHYDHLHAEGVDNWEGYSWPDDEEEEENEE